MSLGFVLAVIIGFISSALFSGVETGGYLINRIRLRNRELARDPAAVTLAKLLRRPLIFVFTVLIGNNVAVYLLSKVVTDQFLAFNLEDNSLLLGFIPWNAEVAATLTLTLPLFILAEVGPKNLFRKKADVLMYRLAGILRILVFIGYPFTWLLRQLFRFLTREMDAEPGRELHRLSADGLKEYFSDSEKEGLISPDQSRMMDNVISMHSVPIRSLMTPLGKTPRLNHTATVADFKALAARRKTTHVLLMDRHRVVGWVSIFRVISRQLGDDQPLLSCAEEMLEIQENRSLKSAFYRLRRNPQHSAIIVDARKHPVGFVQLEAIARYIAGKNG